MPAMPSGTAVCPQKDRQRRLAAQLTDMIPGAATIRVSVGDPMRPWPAPHARVRDAADRPLPLSRTTATVAARWVMRVWPDVDWTAPHTLDLADATLSSAASARAGRGR